MLPRVLIAMRCRTTSWNLPLLLLLWLWIEIRREVFLGDLRFHAIGRHFGLCRPEDRIQRELALFVVAPVVMKVPTGKAEAPAAVGPFHRPSDMLTFLALEHRRAHVRIVVMRAVGPLQRIRGRQIGKDRDDARHPFAEAHVIVPFVEHAERLHAAGDRVLRKRREVWRPVRVDAPVRLEVAAEPLAHFRPALFLRNLDRIMDADETAPALHVRPEFREPVPRKHRMSDAAVGVDDNGVRLGEFLRARPIGVQVDLHVEAIGRALLEAFGKELDPRVVLVRARAVALQAGDQDGGFFRGLCKGGAGGQRDGEEQGEEFSGRGAHGVKGTDVG